MITNESKITDDELLELELLLEERKISFLKKGLTEFDDKTNINYKFLYDSLRSQKWEINKEGKFELTSGFAGCVLEGSSRSGKTWSGIDFIIWLCLYVESNCTILIVRETFTSFSETLYEDFKKRLDDFGLPHNFHDAQRVKQFKIGYNTIKFVGCDKVGKKHGAGSDYVFFNEVMHIPREVFNQLKMRCRKFWWCDYNPSFSDHWLFNEVTTRSDVGFLRTTFRDNPFISPSEKNDILNKECWKSGTYQVTPEGELMYKGQPIDAHNQPPIHETNHAEGTADEYEWKVYGLGLRGAMKGAIIKKIYWMNEFPDIDYTYSNDFGFTIDPNALGKYAEDEHNIYVEVLCYEPIDTDKDLSDHFEAVGVEKDKLITCDSSDKYTGENKGTIEMVRGLVKRGWKAKKVRKTKSVMFWLTSMKKKKIHFVKNGYWKQIQNEKENYVFKEVQGIMVNQPIDKHNHIWDLVRYGHIAHNSPTETRELKKSPKKMGIAW